MNTHSNIITIQGHTFRPGTQNDKIIRYMLNHGKTITVREAFEQLGINSPTKRLSELRAMGLITEKDIKIYGYEGSKSVVRTHYSRYYLEMCDAHDKALIDRAHKMVWEDIDEELTDQCHSDYAKKEIHDIMMRKYHADERSVGLD